MTDLIDEYRRQFAWRDWDRVLDALPDLRGQTVLDLGCGVGDLAASLAARGAKVIGFDLNEELLRAARSRQLVDVVGSGKSVHSIPESLACWGGAGALPAEARKCGAAATSSLR